MNERLMMDIDQQSHTKCSLHTLINDIGASRLPICSSLCFTTLMVSILTFSRSSFILPVCRFPSSYGLDRNPRLIRLVGSMPLELSLQSFPFVEDTIHQSCCARLIAGAEIMAPFAGGLPASAQSLLRRFYHIRLFVRGAWGS